MPLDEGGLRVGQRRSGVVLVVPNPATVRAEVPARRPVVEGEVEQLTELGEVPRIGDPHERLHPAVEVAVHEVGAADVDLGVVAVVEPEDA